MNDTISLLISVGVPAIISIVGFGVTIFTLIQSFQNELVKQKANIQLEKMVEMPYEILELLQEMLDVGKQKSSSFPQKIKEKMDYIFSTIYAYGSSNAIHILAAMQSENYQNAVVPEKTDKYRMMAFFILLTVQIRADITGEFVSPEEWYKMKLTDFQTNRERIMQANNCLVQELNLDGQFMIV